MFDNLISNNKDAIEGARQGPRIVVNSTTGQPVFTNTPQRAETPKELVIRFFKDSITHYKSSNNHHGVFHDTTNTFPNGIHQLIVLRIYNSIDHPITFEKLEKINWDSWAKSTDDSGNPLPVAMQVTQPDSDIGKLLSFQMKPGISVKKVLDDANQRIVVTSKRSQPTPIMTPYQSYEQYLSAMEHIKNIVNEYSKVIIDLRPNKVILFDIRNLYHRQDPAYSTPSAKQQLVDNMKKTKYKDNTTNNNKAIIKLYISTSNYDCITNLPKIETLDEYHNVNLIILPCKLNSQEQQLSTNELDDIFMLLLASFLLECNIEIKIVSDDKYSPKILNNLCMYDKPCYTFPYVTLQSVFPEIFIINIPDVFNTNVVVVEVIPREEMHYSKAMCLQGLSQYTKGLDNFKTRLELYQTSQVSTPLSWTLLYASTFKQEVTSFKSNVLRYRNNIREINTYVMDIGLYLMERLGYLRCNEVILYDLYHYTNRQSNYEYHISKIIDLCPTTLNVYVYNDASTNRHSLYQHIAKNHFKVTLREYIGDYNELQSIFILILAYFLKLCKPDLIVKISSGNFSYFGNKDKMNNKTSNGEPCNSDVFSAVRSFYPNISNLGEFGMTPNLLHSSYTHTQKLELSNPKKPPNPEKPLELPESGKLLELPGSGGPLELPGSEKPLELPGPEEPLELPGPEEPLELLGPEKPLELPTWENVKSLNWPELDEIETIDGGSKSIKYFYHCY